MADTRAGLLAADRSSALAAVAVVDHPMLAAPDAEPAFSGFFTVQLSWPRRRPAAGARHPVGDQRVVAAHRADHVRPGAAALAGRRSRRCSPRCVLRWRVVLGAAVRCPRHAIGAIDPAAALASRSPTSERAVLQLVEHVVGLAFGMVFLNAPSRSSCTSCCRRSGAILRVRRSPRMDDVAQAGSTSGPGRWSRSSRAASRAPNGRARRPPRAVGRACRWCSAWCAQQARGQVGRRGPVRSRTDEEPEDPRARRSSSDIGLVERLVVSGDPLLVERAGPPTRPRRSPPWPTRWEAGSRRPAVATSTSAVVDGASTRRRPRRRDGHQAVAPSASAGRRVTRHAARRRRRHRARPRPPRQRARPATKRSARSWSAARRASPPRAERRESLPSSRRRCGRRSSSRATRRSSTPTASATTRRSSHRARDAGHGRAATLSGQGGHAGRGRLAAAQAIPLLVDPDAVAHRVATTVDGPRPRRVRAPAERGEAPSSPTSRSTRAASSRRGSPSAASGTAPSPPPASSARCSCRCCARSPARSRARRDRARARRQLEIRGAADLVVEWTPELTDVLRIEELLDEDRLLLDGELGCPPGARPQGAGGALDARLARAAGLPAWEPS